MTSSYNLLGYEELQNILTHSSLNLWDLSLYLCFFVFVGNVALCFSFCNFDLEGLGFLLKCVLA